MFLLIANRKESEKIVTEKEDKKFPLFFSFSYFLSFFYGRKTNPPFSTATPFILE